MYFSVVVTSYNCEKYIDETLNSIASQRFTDYEVILIDDHSSDRSVSIINKFIANKENWKVYINEKNIGVARSRNIGFKIAKGKYIAILDSDDVWEPYKLEKQYEFLRDGYVDLCYSTYSLIDENSIQKNYIYKVKEVATYNSLLKENYIGCSTVAFRKEISNDIKMHEEVMHEDYFFWLCIVKAGYIARGVAEPLVKYRVHSKGRSYNKFYAAINRYKIFREHEKIGIMKSVFYLLIYGVYASIKFLRINTNSKRFK